VCREGRVAEFPSVTLLDARAVREALPPERALESQLLAFAALGRGEVAASGKLLLDDGPESTVFCYVARLDGASPAVCKFGSVNPGNVAAGLPAVSATVLVLDPVSGRPRAILDGTELTTLRTAAATALAVSLLAPADAGVLAVLGSGVQGRQHVRAIAGVRTLREVRVWSPTPARLAAAVRELSQQLTMPVQAADSARDAVHGADLVATCTLSATPVLRRAWLPECCLVASVGSFAASRSEVDDDLVDQAGQIIVDDVATALRNAGPIVRASERGTDLTGRLRSLGEVVLAGSPAPPPGLVFFNSTGLGVQDAAAAGMALKFLNVLNGGHTKVAWP
jgi:ornithine cyclodeaminase/alanine dehydrogenase-like protein (mu-crystallin family)